MLIQTTKGLARYFEKLCNIKRVKDIKKAIKLEAEIDDGKYYGERVSLYRYLCEGMKPSDEDEAEILKMLKYYKESLAVFQKMARQIAEISTFDLSMLEVQRINKLSDFTIPAPKIRYRELGEKQVIEYPSFLPQERMFPILSACTFFLCEIATKNVPHSLTTCNYVVPISDRKARKPCGKILLQHNRGRKRKWCASHRTYRSNHKKRIS